MTYDPRIPAREICVLGYQIERWALQKPDEIAIMFYGGETWTWRQTLELTQRTAKGLQAMGVKKGDHVLSWQPGRFHQILPQGWYNNLGRVKVFLVVY